MLHTALERAVRYELIPGNPARLVDPPRVHRERRAEITLDTARALLQSARGDRLEAAYVLALHIREAEGLAAAWYDRAAYPQCQPPNRVTGDGKACDEFPNGATAQSGPPESRSVAGPTASLRAISEQHNSLEGTRYRQFLALSGCGLVERDPFLVIPLADDDHREVVFPETTWACEPAAP